MLLHCRRVECAISNKTKWMCIEWKIDNKTSGGSVMEPTNHPQRLAKVHPKDIPCSEKISENNT